MRLASVSVDLDEIPNYYAIHGLAPPEGREATLVYDVAIDRLKTLAAAARMMPLTLFAIGSDLSRESSARALAGCAKDGHEIANHSQDHLYDLTRRGREEIRAQIEGGADAIAKATGSRPVGFRAPGYTVSDTLFEVLGELGVFYDASVFPSPAYWAAKAAKISAIAVRGRKSRSVVDTPRVLMAPTRPYPVGRPYWRRGNGVIELPIQVTRALRLPFIGTSVTLAGADRARILTRMCVGEPFVNLELHGVDVLDASDGLGGLAKHQFDLRVDKNEKLDALDAALGVLRGAGYTFVTMRESAERFAAHV